MTELKKYLEQTELETEIPLEKSPVCNLQESINLVINLQAENLRLMAQGKIPEILVNANVWDGVLKMVEIMPKLEHFEKITNGGTKKSNRIVKPTKETEVIDEHEIFEGNAFEEMSKRVKQKLNGKTDIVPKDN